MRSMTIMSDSCDICIVADNILITMLTKHILVSFFVQFKSTYM